MNCSRENRYSVLTVDEELANTTNFNPTRKMEEVPRVDTPPKREYIRSNKTDEFPCLKIELKTVDTSAALTVDALLDSGATGLYVDAEFIHANGLATKRLARAIPVYNVDGTLNDGGAIKETINFVMRIEGHTECATFAVCNLGK